jgi:hypothetical protein
VSYTIEWFIPNGSEPLEKQAEMAPQGNDFPPAQRQFLCSNRLHRKSNRWIPP